MENRVLVEIIAGNYRLNDTVNDSFSELAVRDIRAVLGRDDNVFDFDRLAVTVFYGHLGFAVGTKEVRFAALAHLGQVMN